MQRQSQVRNHDGEKGKGLKSDHRAHVFFRVFVFVSTMYLFSDRVTH